MKTVKGSLVFESYCWEGLEKNVPAKSGVFVTYSCDKKGDELVVANVLFARASTNLATDIRLVLNDSTVRSEKEKNRRIYSTYAVVEEMRVAIAAASAIQYVTDGMLDASRGRFRFFRYGNVDFKLEGKWLFGVPKAISLKVNDCLEKLSDDDLLAYRSSIRVSGVGDRVRNVIDTADDEAPDGGSWISFWRKVVGHDEPAKCPDVLCRARKHPLDGAHVVIRGDVGQVVYVMPLCDTYNRSRSKEWIEIAPGIEMIPVGEG